MVQDFLFIRIESELFQDQGIPFDDLAGGKARRKPDSYGMVFDHVLHRVDAPVYRTAVVFRCTEILIQGLFLVFCNVNGMLDKFIDALSRRCRNRHHRCTEHLFHRIDINVSAIVGDLIHHVQGNHHRYAHLQQLHRQVQVPLYIRRVHDIDDCVRLLLQYKVAGYDFLAGIR